MRLLKHAWLPAIALGAMFAGPAIAADCPAITVADNQGLTGEFPQQFELSEFQELAGCTMTFKENPDIAALNAQIQGNPAELPPVAERLPDEPLVVVPYDAIGTYGGTLNMLSNASEAGTSDFMSMRHTNMVRYSDDLKTIVPNVAKSWEWNEDFTALTFHLRKGHKWSDGEPFTAEDIKFWYDNLQMDTNVIEKPQDYVLVAGEPMEVEIIDPQTVTFHLPAPKPGLLAHFATHYAAPFQPRHFLGQFHPAINPDADKRAQELGFKDGYEALTAYYVNSDWMDVATPMLRYPDKVPNLPMATKPTLESHFIVSETTEGRHLVANPYYFMVDTAGNQLPYISEQDEIYVNEHQVRLLKLVNGEVDYKTQSLSLADAPILLEGQEKGAFTVQLKPKVAFPVFSFNLTDENMAKRELFNDLRFRQAMSLAMNRQEINEVAYFGQGEPQQYVSFSPAPEFVDEKWKSYYAEFDPEKAKALLDEIGMVDTDGDGMRELPNGEKITLNMQFATQGLPTPVVELVAQHWKNVGVDTAVKEVTPDEYRSAQSANSLSVHMWEKSQPLSVVLATSELFVPPFENYFFHRNGMLWAEWVATGGKEGVEPPDWVKQMMEDINAFQSAPVGGEKSDTLGASLVEAMTSHLVFLGTVKATSPIVHTNRLVNVPEYKTASYEYYWSYPYRPTQWFFSETE